MPRSAADAPRIDDADECIWRGGQRIAVRPKAFTVLRWLRQHPDQLVTKQELLDACWPDAHVIDVVLNNAITHLRQALGDDAKHPRFIETVHRRGFRWIGPRADAAGVVPGDGPLDDDPTPFVGRDAVLAELEGCRARAAGGRRQLVFVTGEPGIGKTRLVTRFLAGLGRSGALVAHGQCVEQFGMTEAYRPLLEAVEALLRGAPAETRAVFAAHAPTWLLQMPEVLSPDEREGLRHALTASTPERMQRELVRAIAAASAERAVVLVLEDLHWSDHATIGLLWALVAHHEPARLLVIATYRPVDAIAEQHPVVRLKHELAGKRLCTEIALDGLDGAAVESLIDGRFAGHRLPAVFAGRLHARTDGNPLFLLDTLGELEQRGWLSAASGAWQCTVDLAELDAAVPDGTRQQIAFRLDRLPEATLALLEAAALIGVTFATQSVAAALERDDGDVEAECDRLARSALFLREGCEVTWPDGSRGREHVFRHALYQQVLAQRAAPSLRRARHRRIAARLEQGYGARGDEVAGALSLHYEQAGEPFRAVDWIERSVRQANARCATREAEALLGHAVALLRTAAESPARQERLLTLTVAHGLALGASRGSTSDLAGQAFEAARALGQSMPTSTEHLTSLASLAVGRLMKARLHDAHSLGAQLRALVGEDGPPHAVISADLASGTALLYLGDLEGALPHLQRAAAVAEASPMVSDPTAPLLYDPIVPLHATLGMALVLAGQAERGRAMVESGVARAREIEMPWYLGFALAAASTTAILRDDVDDARCWTDELLTRCETSQLPLWLEMARVKHAWLAVRAGEAGSADALRAAVDDFRRIGRLATPRMLHLLADGYRAVGRLDDATAAVDEAFAVRGEERFFDAELLRQRAAILRARTPGRGRRAQAERTAADEQLERAIELATAQGNRLFALRATVELCRSRPAGDRRAAPRERLAAALAGFSEGFAEPDLRAARALLDTSQPRQRAARRH